MDYGYIINTRLLVRRDVSASITSFLPLSFFLLCDVILLSAANNQTGAAYVYSVNSTGAWSLNQRLICSFSSPTVAPSTRQPRSPSTSPVSSPVSASSIYSAPCGSSASFGFKVGIYQNSTSNSFLIIGAPNYCKYFAIYHFYITGWN